MSRTSEGYQFVDTDAAAITAQLVSLYEVMAGHGLSPASPEMLILRWVATVVIQERVLNNYTGQQNLASEALSENLDILGSILYGLVRPAAKPATATERFTISEAQGVPILIPAGTRVTDSEGELYFATTEDAYIPEGDTYIDLHVECQTPGVSGNGYVVGQLNQIVDVFDYYTACANITESADGSDEATDDEYYDLMVASLDGYSCAGAEGAYVYHAMKVSTEIADVKAVVPRRTVKVTKDVWTHGSAKAAFIGAPSLLQNTLEVYTASGGTLATLDDDYTLSTSDDGLLTITLLSTGILYSRSTIYIEADYLEAGKVALYVLMNDGTIATTETKNAVLAACNAAEARPMTDTVEVRDPEAVTYNIDLTYYIPSNAATSSADIQEKVNQAVADYKAWQSERLGRDINPSHLISLLMQTGIKRVALTAPAFTVLHDGTDHSVPQIATCGTVTVTNGGFENE